MKDIKRQAQQKFNELMKLNYRCGWGEFVPDSFACGETPEEAKENYEKKQKEESGSTEKNSKSVVDIPGIGKVTKASKEETKNEAIKQIRMLRANASPDMQKISTIADAKKWLDDHKIPELQQIKVMKPAYVMVPSKKDPNKMVVLKEPNKKGKMVGVKQRDKDGKVIKVEDVGLESPTKRITELMQNEDFRKLSVFDRARVAAQMERGTHKNEYKGEFTIGHKKTGNMKMTDELEINGKRFRIIGADTVQGCDQMCLECYANKMAGSTPNISHQNAVKAQLKGSLHNNEIMRIGTNGEPAKSWKHTALQVKDLVERSRKSKTGSEVTPEKNIFFISKMLNIEGFDPNYIKNVEVSVDPLYPDHVRQTMVNVLRVKTMYPETNFVMRIRSLQSKDPGIMAVQEDAVDFANTFGFPILETKLRFNKDITAEVLDLDMNQYSRHLVEQSPDEIAAGEKPRKENQLKLNAPVLKKDFVNKNSRVCNEKNEGSGACAICHACYDLMVDDKIRSENIKGSAEKIKALGVDLSAFRDPTNLDVRGGVVGGVRPPHTKKNPEPVQIKMPKKRATKKK